MKLSEEPFFGFQGEGNTQGKNSLFIRIPKCNLRCRFCDSKFTWDEGIDFSNSILNEMLNKARNVVITGGEPLLKRNHDIINSWVRRYSADFEIETNGTIPLSGDVVQTFNHHKVQLNISPKENILQKFDKIDTAPYMMETLPKYYILKFLFTNEKDIKYILDFQEKYKIPSSKIYVQPRGIDLETLVQTIKINYNTIVEKGWNLSLRSHIVIFGNKQGV